MKRFYLQGYLILCTRGALRKLPVPNLVSMFGEEGEHKNSSVWATHFSGQHKQHALQPALCLFLPQSTGITPSAPQELAGCSVFTTLKNVYTRDREKTTASGSRRKLGWRAPSPSGHTDITMKLFHNPGYLLDLVQSLSEENIWDVLL